MSTIVDLVRHGTVEGPPRLLGLTEAPVTAAGLAALDRQASRRNWQAIVTSPRDRARAGAEHVARRRGAAVTIDADWAEMDFGAWDGRPLAELKAEGALGDAFATFLEDPTRLGPPGGEDWETFTRRLARGLDRVAGVDAAPGTVAVVTHAGALRGALAVTTGLRLVDLWRLRIEYGTRVTLHYGRAGDGRLWGEIVEVVQP